MPDNSMKNTKIRVLNLPQTQMVTSTGTRSSKSVSHYLKNITHTASCQMLYIVLLVLY